MIRAHLATFPARAGILMQAVRSILPQVDRLFICLNQYDAVPAVLADESKIECLIPDRDLKDAGKFALTPGSGDMVFTMDDDIIYPTDYVEKTLSSFDKLDPDRNIVGHLGNAWCLKGKEGARGWKNYMFMNRVPKMVKVDILGTGTTCQTAKNLPRLDQIESAAGFVDLRHARLHSEAGRWMWALPHSEDWMRSTMTDDLKPTSLFLTVNRAGHPAMRAELVAVMQSFTPHSGEHFDKLASKGGFPDRRA